MTETTMDHPSAPVVFISYSHRDQKWVDALLEHLKPLKRQRLLDCWSDAEVKAGDHWRAAIERALNGAVVAVLLVSPAFLASDFIAQNELPPLLQRARGGTLKIFWVPVSASVYAHTDIEQYQAAHDPRKPLDSLPKAKRNEAMVKIASDIVQAVDRSNMIVPSKEATRTPPQPGGREDYESPSAITIRPTLMIVYRREGWYLQNTGRGPSLNTVVAQLIVKGPQRGTWVNPVRVPTLAAEHEALLAWLDHTNDTGLGAVYEDEDGRVFSSITSNDLTRVIRGREIPAFDEETIRRHWKVGIGAPRRIGGQ
jgi:hypothetical protein